MRKLMWITLVVAAAACGNGAGDGSGGNGGGAGNGGGGSAGGGGGGMTQLPSTLAGTWELIGSPSDGVGGLLLLSSTSIHVTMVGITFDLQVAGAPALTYTAGSYAPAFTVSHTPVAVDYGAFPTTVGGDWMFAGPGGGTCVGSFRADAATGGCTHAGASPTPMPSLNRQVHATRAQKLDSIFGELGGTWNIADDGSGTCTVTLSGATLIASCKNGTSAAGGITMTFSDGVASGFTDGGAEFSARRR